MTASEGVGSKFHHIKNDFFSLFSCMLVIVFTGIARLKYVAPT